MGEIVGILEKAVGNFSLHHRVQNGSGAQPASYPIPDMFWGLGTE
jgi:hypothetical protein